MMWVITVGVFCYVVLAGAAAALELLGDVYGNIRYGGGRER